MILTIDKKYNYDEEHDILYYNVGEYSPSLADEIVDYIYVKKSVTTDAITQVMIEDFKNINLEKLRNTEIELLKNDLEEIQKLV